MKATQKLHDLGQSLWVDNITRDMLGEGTLQGYIDDLSVTGLTSNPSIFEKGIGAGDSYDEQIAEIGDGAEDEGGAGVNAEENIFFELALSDLRDAADLFADVHKRTGGVDGFVSLEVSPLLADDAKSTIDQAANLHRKAERDNLFVKIPGTPAGLEAIEESIFAGIPINVTLLFDDKQYLAAADAYMKGIERRIDAGLDKDRIYDAEGLVKGGNTMFIATGVTDGGLVEGVRRKGPIIRTESILLRSRSGTLRRITSDHLAERWL